MPITRQIITDIINKVETDNTLDTPLDKELFVMKTFPTLYEEYPFLLKKLCKVINDEENLNMLYLLIDRMDAISSGKESKTVVEAELGQQLADKYIKPGDFKK